MDRKKAGILTFHRSRNYGAVLQGYALQQKMTEFFDEVDIIDYQNPEIEEVVKLWNMNQKGLKGFLRALLGFVFRYRKKTAFDSYIKKYMSCSPKADRENISQVCKKYDVIISGSDQVWNTVITGNDKTYFLDFAAAEQKKIAYAASFGDSHTKLDESVRAMIKDFDLVTLRESVMLDEVSAVCEAQLCCDPTLLISSEKWKEHAAKKLTDKKYVFLLVIDENRELVEYAQKVAKEKNLTLISNKNDMSFFMHPRPDEFLSWVLNAEYVITNSFHGTVFSLLFEKKFVSHMYTEDSIPKKRIAELLGTVGMEHRNTRNDLLDIDGVENWEYVGDALKKIRDSSWSVISNCFEK